MKDDHFLRPTFTGYVIGQLRKGASLNLYGAPGIGKSRLLEDIEKTELPGVRVVRVSFKGYQNSHAGFCEAVRTAAGIGGRPVKRLNTLIRKLHEGGDHVFLLIDDFKYLHDNPELDAGYNQQFIDALNAVRNMPGVSLMAVTEEPANSVLIYMKKKPVTSSLNLTPLEMTELQEKDIRSEQGRWPGNGNLSETEINRLVSCLLNAPCNYGFMNHIQPKLLSGADSVLSIDERLNRWEDGFKRECRVNGAKLVVRGTTKMKGWLIVLNPFRQTFKQLKRLLQGPVAFIQQFLPPKDKQ